MEEYAAWLVAELERLGDPVDLVGHDWGGGFVVRVVSTRPELVRSWVTDAAGIGDVEFEWHDFAKIWQTPQAGEDFWDQQLATSTEERAGVFQMFGVPEEPALDLASHINRTMADCILDLYRSAVDVGWQWGPDFAAIPAPGLVIIPGEDPFLSAASATKAAARAGARRSPSMGSATGGCSRTLPERRPSCASSGPPWPDSVRSEAARPCEGWSASRLRRFPVARSPTLSLANVQPPGVRFLKEIHASGNGHRIRT